MHYLRLETVATDGAAQLTHIRNFEDDFKLYKGMRLRDTFPANAEYRMDGDFPDGMRLTDFLDNLDTQLIINRRTRDVFTAQCVQHVEFLPVQIVNHKRRKVTEDYWIANLLLQPDCIDRDSTQFTWDALDEEMMDEVANLTLDESGIPDDALLFRPKHLNPLIVVHCSLVNMMMSAGITGFRASELEDYEE